MREVLPNKTIQTRERSVTTGYVDNTMMPVLPMSFVTPLIPDAKGVYHQPPVDKLPDGDDLPEKNLAVQYGYSYSVEKGSMYRRTDHPDGKGVDSHQ